MVHSGVCRAQTRERKLFGGSVGLVKGVLEHRQHRMGFPSWLEMDMWRRHSVVVVADLRD